MQDNELVVKKVLVVDDEPLILELLVEEFAYYGAKVFSAKNVQEAKIIVDREKLDVVLTDLTMPGGDGISLIKDIQASKNPVKNIFLCTGYHNELEQNAKKLGILAVFSKPIDMERLLTLVGHTLSNPHYNTQED